MANIETHDEVTTYVAILSGVATFWHTADLELSLLLSSAAFFSGYMFGPDLDHPTGSKPIQRWGILRWIWNPYRSLLIPRHRHPLSHFPVLGTIVRVLYIGSILALAAIPCLLLLAWIGYPISIADAIRILASIGNQFEQQLTYSLAGLIVGDIGHIAADYPPSTWRRLIRLRSRRRRR